MRCHIPKSPLSSVEFNEGIGMNFFRFVPVIHHNHDIAVCLCLKK